MYLKIPDNYNGDADKEITPEQISDLKKISEKKLKDLCVENRSLLVFPSDLKNSKDCIGELPIITLFESGEKIKVKTGNLMGFVGVENTILKIHSRFDSSENDYFFHYMLCKVFNINLVNFSVKSSIEDDVLKILYIMFPALLNRALSKGVFRKYRTFERNDSRVKGPIDIARHIKKNIPFNGRIAYKSREYSYDNEITELIRHTIEFIRNSIMGPALFKNKDFKENVAQIELYTPNYNKSDRQQIIAKNKRPLTHTYYTEYSQLQELCLMILQRKTTAYKNSKQDIYGILFDGAWLFEEYLWTILKDCGFLHPENKARKGGIYLFEKWKDKDDEKIVEDKTYHSRYRRYPDFYKKGKFILDAKYKKLEDKKIPRDDIHQIISYMYVEQAKKGGLIYPISGGESVTQDKIGTLRGHGGEIEKYAFPIPNKLTNFSEFVSNIQKIETQLKNKTILMSKETI